MKKHLRTIAFVLVLTLLTGTLPTELFSFEVVAAQEGYTSNAPFSSESVHSSYFRSPALVTRGDGVLLAAADAVWSASDRTGADTVTSISSDGGAVWKWHYANYLGDNGDQTNAASTSFRDPALAVQGNTAYLLVELYPGGVSENDNTATRFDEQGRLLLSKDSEAYYLDDGKIYSENGVQVTDYTVDEYFNLYNNGTHESNLFFSNAAYKVAQTGFLYLTKSTDGGKTWSAPTLLNAKSGGPASGRGLVTSDGTILFPTCDTNLGFLSSADAATWTSTTSSISAATATAVQIDNTVRFFYSDGTNLCYVDYKDDSWGDSVTTEAACSASSRISAVTYPQKVNGKTAVIVSCASSGTSGGRLVALTDGELLNTCAVTGGYFADSCLTLTQDGRVALLYESAAGEIDFTRMDIVDVLGAQAVIGDDPYLADEAGHRVTAITLILKKGSEQVTLKNPNNAEVKGITSSDEAVVTAACADDKLTLTPVEQGTATVTLSVGETALTLRVTVEQYLTESITLTVGETTTVVLDGEFGEGNTLPSDNKVVEVTTAVIGENITQYAQEPLPDGEYCICTSQSENNWPLTAETAESGTRLTIGSGSVTSASVHWKFEKQTDGTYYISYNGQYLNVGLNDSEAVTVSSTPQKLLVAMDSGKWYIRSATHTRYLNQWGGSSSHAAGAYNVLDDGSHWYLYQYSASGTQVTFTGMSEGNALAIVGYTKFNIKVKLPEKHLVTTVGNSVTIKASGADDATKSADFDTYVTMDTTSDGTITFTGKVTTGKTPPSVVLNGTRYSIAVLSAPPATLTSETTPILGTAGEASGNPVTALGIGTGEASAYTLCVASGKEVYWCSSDETVCTVDENGTVTGTYSGDDPYAKATVTALIDGVPYSIPVTVWNVNNDTTTKKTIDVYSYEVIHSRSYYSLWAHDLHDFPEGAYLNIVMDSTHVYALNFFGAPEDGYVLTYCSQPGSSGIYAPFESISEVTTIYMQTSGWGDNKGVTQKDVQDMLAQAKAAGAQGAFFNTRGSGADTLSIHNLIASEKLPTVEKTLAGVLRKSAKTFHSYTGARMTAEVGDYVYFTIAVTQEAPEVWSTDVDTNGNKSGLLTYSDAKLLDKFTNGEGECSFYSAEEDSNGDGWIDTTELSEKDITDQLNAAWTQSQIEAGKRELVYYVVYEVSNADLALSKDDAGNILPQIVNTVDLSYSYTSKYSRQTGDKEANAEANVLVVGKYIGQYVIDFGLPLEITITGSDSGFGYVNTDAEKWYDSAYGVLSLKKDATKQEYTLTYTPSQILATSDEVLIYREETDDSGQTMLTVNSLTIVPATSVYYEDAFIEKGGWTSEGAAEPLHQDADILGDLNGETPVKAHPYGFDAAYSGAFAASGGTWLEATIAEQDGEKDFPDGPTASFTFTGTGFELYAVCTESTGTLRVEITPTVSGKLGAYIVDTKVRAGSSAATTGQNGEYYGLPIVSVTDLPWGSYTVTLKKLRADGAVMLDGVRIHGTVKEAAGKDSLYYADREDHPEYFELRDYVLRAMGVADLGQTLQIFADQVYNRSYSAIVFDTSLPYDDATAEDLLRNGPKNELFLWKGQSVTFKVKTSRLMQLGMKAPQGATSAVITLDGNAKNMTVNSVVDMFYELGNTQGTEREWTITVNNTGENVLSLTKLKICDDPDAAIVPLTESEVNDALIGLGALTESDRAEAVTEVVLVDHTGDRLATATLRRPGLNGVTTVFSASAILDAARAALPEHYALVNESAVTHAEVACGSTRTVFVQIGQVATVELTYISLTTRRVCTVTVTKVQFEDGACRISAAELMRVSPLGRRLLSTRAISVPYGQTCAVTVLVL